MLIFPLLALLVGRTKGSSVHVTIGGSVQDQASSLEGMPGSVSIAHPHQDGNQSAVGKKELHLCRCGAEITFVCKCVFSKCMLTYQLLQEMLCIQSRSAFSRTEV